MIKQLLFFVFINFTALALGSLFTPSGISSEWYQTLHKAPWTPPGWFFGVAWTTIMICLSFFMTLRLREGDKKLLMLYSLQLVLNVSWTPIFFYFHLTTLALLVIVLLTLLVGYMMVNYSSKRHYLLLLPYFVWLCVATSLNTYVVFCN